MKVELMLVAAGTCLFGMSEPTSAAVWTLTSAPSNQWVSVAASADGIKIVAAAILPGVPPGDVRSGPIYLSTNSGETWFQSGAPSNRWYSVASSADGNKLVAAGYPFGLSAAPGPIFTSKDSGFNWTQSSAPSNRWVSVASSADGSKLAAAIYGGRIYTSTNSGDTWTQTSAPIQDWYSVASSADGNKLAAVVHGTFPSGIFASTNAGQTWTQTSAPIKTWSAIASSADGAILTALIFNEAGIYTSTNSGVNWSSNDAPRKGWTTVATSADGERQIAAAPLTVSSAQIYSSTNSGGNWSSEGMPSLSWSSVASSADGAKLYAAVKGGGIYTSQSTPTPKLRLALLQNELMLAWTVPSTDFALQQNSDLSTTNWVVVSDIPVLNLTNLQNEVRLPFFGGNRFYRLATP